MLANVVERHHLYNLMAADKEYALLERELCRQNPFHFFEFHLWTHDPRGAIIKAYGWKDSQLPFLLFDFQKRAIEKYISAIENGHDVLTEKSRDMGVSWLLVSLALWYWLKPTSGNDILLGSRKFEYADKKGSLDTLMEKFRYNLYNLRPVFMPEGFMASAHDNVGSILNPQTSSFVRAEANNENFATSGRYLFILVDEFSKWKDTDSAAWTSMGDSTQTRIPVSTPWGMGRKFAKLRFDGSIEVQTFHWTEHPIKSAGMFRGPHPIFKEKTDVWLSPWYLTEVARRSQEGQDAMADVSQDLDIEYLGSGYPWFNNHIVQQEYKKLEENPPKLKRYEIVRHRDEDGEDYIELDPVEYGRVWIHKQPVEGWRNRYCIAADPAEGLEHGDSTALYVYDRVDKTDVAGFCGRLNEEITALLLIHFGKMYGDAYLAIESNNSMGGAVIQSVKGKYEHLMHHQNYDQMVDFDSVKLGWNTNKSTRGTIVKGLREAINGGVHGIVEKEVFSECMTFENINGKPQASAGNCDDRVMCQAIKWALHEWLPNPEKIDTSVDRFAGIKPFSGGKKSTEIQDKRRFW